MSLKRFISNFFIAIILLIVFLPVILFFAFQIKPVQHFLNDKITYIVEENLNSKVSIGKISYHAPFDIVLSNFLINDYKEDTLFFVKQLKIRPLIFNTKKDILLIDRIKIEGMRAKYRADSTGFSNLDYFLLNLPAKSDTTKSSSSNFKIKIRKIEIQRSSVFYTSSKKDSLPYDFDIDTLNIFRFGLRVKNFLLNKDGISLKLERFSAFEKSGFRIKGLSANVSIDKNNIDVSKMILRLNRTRIFLDNFNMKKDTLKNIELYSIKIKNYSEVNFSDLGYFSHYFKNYNQQINFGGNISGTINNLLINNLYLKYRQNTYVDLSGRLVGLSDFKNSYFNLNIKKLQSSKSDLFAFKNPLTDRAFLELPQSIQIPDNISFTGTTKGLISNFNLNGNFISSSGNISINLNVIDDSNSVGLGGTFSLKNLDLSYLLKNKLLGTLSLKDSINISLKNKKNIKGYNKSNISQFIFNGYNYKNTEITADFTESSILTRIIFADSNFRANIDLNAKIKNKNINAKYSINLDTAQLYPLHFSGDDKLAAISFGISGFLSGKDINDIEGKLKFSRPLVLIKNLQKLEINKFNIELENLAQINDNFYRLISINSDFLKGKISGTISPESLTNFFSNIQTYYFPALGKDSIRNIFVKGDRIGTNMKIDLQIKNLKPILDIFAPTIFIANNSKITGFFSDAKNKFNLNFSSDSIIFSKNKVKNISVNIVASKEDFNFSVKSDSIGLSKLNLQDFTLLSSAKNNIGKIKFSWKNKSKKKNYGSISSLFSVSSDSAGTWILDINIPKDSVFINNTLWTIKSKKIHFDSSGININNLTFSTKYIGQNIGIRGKISDKAKDSLYIYISKFDISQVNPILDNIKLNGFLQTQAIISHVLNKPNIVVDNRIERLRINDVRLGYVEQNFSLNSKSGLLKTNLSLQKYGKVQKIVNGKSILKDTMYRSLSLLAKYSMNNENYDANLIIDNFKLKAFAPYLKKYVAFSRNTNLNGNLFIKGDKIFYDVQGFLNLYGSFHVFSTGVNYTINRGLRIRLFHNLIKIEKTVIAGPDLVGDATLWGTIKHHEFRDPYLDLSLKADTISVLDLPRTSSGKYYGKVVASGNIEIKGYPENLKMTADITAEPETKLTLLLDRPEEVTNKTNIVTFINPADTTKLTIKKQKKENTNSNIDLDLNLSLNPDAKFKLIFNEMTGESLDIQGEGDVKIKKTAFGDVVLFGKIAIVNGSYKFILENIINRRFVITKGSSITFNGAPTDGVVDISTLYTVKNVNLYNLLLDDKYTDVKTQANCYIKLKGPILKPKIKFDVDLPKADRRIAAQIQNLDDANKNKQFLSLLLIGRFQPLPGLTPDPNSNMLAGTFNAGELISNQLNSFLTNLGTNVDLDVNYVTKNNTTPGQFDVALSVPLLNEKVSINTDVGGTNINTTDKTNFIGDFEVDVKLNKKGNLQLKGYNRSNRNSFYEQGYTQGIGLLYKSDLDNIFKRDTAKKRKVKHKKKKGEK